MLETNVFLTQRRPPVLYLITGSRTLSPRRDSRRGKKSCSKSPSQRSLSSSPELSDEPSEQTPEPQVSTIYIALVDCYLHSHSCQTSPQYASCAELPQQTVYCSVDVPIEAAVATYTTLPQPECPYPNDQPSSQYYAQSSQYYCQDWSNVAQPSQTAYHSSSQQWVNYFPQPESQPQSQQFVYYGPQYY